MLLGKQIRLFLMIILLISFINIEVILVKSGGGSKNQNPIALKHLLVKFNHFQKIRGLGLRTPIYKQIIWFNCLINCKSEI